MDKRINEPQDERRFLIDLVFKPEVLQGQPSPAEIQLILAHIGEILAEIEAEEKRLANEPESGNPPCK